MIGRLDPENPPTKEQLREIRDQELQLSIRALAKALGYHYLTIWRYERGDTSPSRAFLRDLQSFRDKEAHRRTSRPSEPPPVKQKRKTTPRKPKVEQKPPEESTTGVELPSPPVEAAPETARRQEPQQTPSPGDETSTQTPTPTARTSTLRELLEQMVLENRQLGQLVFRMYAFTSVVTLGAMVISCFLVVYATRPQTESHGAPEGAQTTYQPPRADAGPSQEEKDETPYWTPPNYLGVADGGTLPPELRRMPSEPFSWQKRAPCDPRREVEKNGGCWREVKSPPPCGDFEVQDGDTCFVPVPAPPTSKGPKVTGPRLNGDH